MNNALGQRTALVRASCRFSANTFSNCGRSPIPGPVAALTTHASPVWGYLPAAQIQVSVAHLAFLVFLDVFRRRPRQMGMNCRIDALARSRPRIPGILQRAKGASAPAPLRPRRPFALDVIHADALQVVAGALEVPALFPVELQEGACIFHDLVVAPSPCTGTGRPRS